MAPRSHLDPERIPVVIASGQSIERTELVTPVDLMERASEAALHDAPVCRSAIGRVSVVDTMTRPGRPRQPSWPTG